MIADELLEIARRLVAINPTQTDLRRATSSIYYAMFHSICQSNADALVGDSPQDRDQLAWRQAYRALEHGYARQRCQQTRSDDRFSTSVQRFAAYFVNIQTRRHRADYDPDTNFVQQEVLDAINEADDSIAAFRTAPESERRAFAVYILMRNRQE